MRKFKLRPYSVGLYKEIATADCCFKVGVVIYRKIIE